MVVRVDVAPEVLVGLFGGVVGMRTLLFVVLRSLTYGSLKKNAPHSNN